MSSGRGASRGGMRENEAYKPFWEGRGRGGGVEGKGKEGFKGLLTRSDTGDIVVPG